MSDPRSIVIEFCYEEDENGFWIVVLADRKVFHRVAFESPGERENAQQDILKMMQTQLNANPTRLQ